MLFSINNENFIFNEFRDLNFGDHRLNQRAIKVAQIINNSPQLSFPNAAKGNKYALKALYRFFQNDKVTLQKMMETHYLNTIERCLISSGPILLITDSVFMSPPKRNMMEGLKAKGRSDNNNLRIHYMIAVDGNSQEILGITDFRVIGENVKKTNIHLKEECDIWELVTKTTLKRISDHFQDSFEELRAKLIFIADREADAYHIFDSLSRLQINFIIRSAYRRRLEDKGTNELVLFKDLAQKEILHGRPYDLKIYENGKGKIFKVQRSILNNYTLYPPERNSSLNSKKYEIYDPMKISMIFVKEINPEETTKLTWKIFTSLNISNHIESKKVVEYYKCRWKIEELNKSAKTGVNLEHRQFTNLDHLKPAIGMIFIIAWRILALRDLSKVNGDSLAKDVMSEDEIDYLVEKLEVPIKKLKISIVMDYIARQGGFIGSYENPGWIVLWKGWFQFILQVEGFTFAKSIYKNNSK